MPPIHCKLAKRHAVLERVLRGRPGPWRRPDPARPRIFVGMGVLLSAQRNARELHGLRARRVHALPGGRGSVQGARTSAG
eukprot:7411472-Pyramimonas_sp.AAC.1